MYQGKPLLEWFGEAIPGLASQSQDDQFSHLGNFINNTFFKQYVVPWNMPILNYIFGEGNIEYVEDEEYTIPGVPPAPFIRAT